MPVHEIFLHLTILIIQSVAEIVDLGEIVYSGMNWYYLERDRDHYWAQMLHKVLSNSGSAE
jgi:hypothetical protein